MKVIILGASGMVGQGVLRECLIDPEVERVVTLVRSPTGQSNEKIDEVVHPDLFDLSSIEAKLAGLDACFFCLGVTSSGMTEEAYHRVTYDLTMAVAGALLAKSPEMTFVFVSGAGSDSTEKGRTMWARVKGKAENAILGMPFKAKYVFRPAFIRPGPGITSRTRSYRILGAVLNPLYPALKALFPKWTTTTERVGQAMLEVARHGADKAILESADIDRLGARALAAATPVG